jgi:hypothetical protein
MANWKTEKARWKPLKTSYESRMTMPAARLMSSESSFRESRKTGNPTILKTRPTAMTPRKGARPSRVKHWQRPRSSTPTNWTKAE